LEKEGRAFKTKREKGWDSPLRGKKKGPRKGIRKQTLGELNAYHTGPGGVDRKNLKGKGGRNQKGG